MFGRMSRCFGYRYVDFGSFFAVLGRYEAILKQPLSVVVNIIALLHWLSRWWKHVLLLHSQAIGKWFLIFIVSSRQCLILQADLGDSLMSSLFFQKFKFAICFHIQRVESVHVMARVYQIMDMILLIALKTVKWRRIIPVYKRNAWLTEESDGGPW